MAPVPGISRCKHSEAPAPTGSFVAWRQLGQQIVEAIVCVADIVAFGGIVEIVHDPIGYFDHVRNLKHKFKESNRNVQPTRLVKLFDVVLRKPSIKALTSVLMGSSIEPCLSMLTGKGKRPKLSRSVGEKPQGPLFVALFVVTRTATAGAFAGA